jgi:hypothetical protein
MAVATDESIAADGGIIMGGVDVVATITVGGIIAITGDLPYTSYESPPNERPLRLLPLVHNERPLRLLPLVHPAVYPTGVLPMGLRHKLTSPSICSV